MIYHPRVGTDARIHYAKDRRSQFPHHGRIGRIVSVGKGPGPRNVGVLIDGATVVVPRGNLIGFKTSY